MTSPDTAASKLTVRLSAALHYALVRQALENDRSLNAEVVHLLRFALRHYPPRPDLAATERDASTGQ